MPSFSEFHQVEPDPANEVSGAASSTDELDILMRHLPGMAYRCENDLDWTMRFVSFGCRELTGYDPADLVGNARIAFGGIIHPDDREHVWFTVQDAVGKAGDFLVEYRIVTADGTVKWVWDRGSAYRDVDGKVRSIDGFITDNTERRQNEEQLRETLKKLQGVARSTVMVLARVVELKDPYTAGHQKKVSLLAQAIARDLGMDENTVDAVGMAGLVHDIGKITVPSEILSKPTRLTDIEFALVKDHSRQGRDILTDMESPWPLASIVYQHHERMNGSGYPLGIHGNDIMPEARILAVADVVEAIFSDRPYRPGLGIDTAIEEIHTHAGDLYDADVARSCERLLAEGGFVF